MNRRIAFAVLTTALVVGLLVGGIAYVAGLNGAGVVATAPGTVPGAVVYPVWHGFGFFWPFFGFLFFLLLIGFLVRAFGGWGRGSYGPRGGWGPGGWDRSRWEAGEVPPPVDTALQNWHRRAHGDGPTPPAGR